jgi:glycosyltransferase involved in cell wall biosynthesis
LYSNAKAFVTATLHEGFGLPLVEALFCGTKVIGSNIDVVKEATDSKAIYFNPIDDKELAFILQNIDNYPKSSLTKEEIARKYSEENTSGQYIELLNSVKDLKILDSVR